MSDTTSIDDLPTDPSSGNMNNNVVIQKMEMNNGGNIGGGMPQGQVYNPVISGLGPSAQQQQQQLPQNMMMSNNVPNSNPSVMNEMIAGLQRASASGMTNLPSRDIPMGTSNMMNDAQINPNYIPNQQMQQMQQMNSNGISNMNTNANYIEDHDQDITNEDRYKKNQSVNSTAENIYKLMQIPVIVGILYFTFQLPVTRKYVLKFIPSVFNIDGNYNISGLIFMSSLFALSFFGLSKLLEMSESW